MRMQFLRRQGERLGPGCRFFLQLPRTPEHFVTARAESDPRESAGLTCVDPRSQSEPADRLQVRAGAEGNPQGPRQAGDQPFFPAERTGPRRTKWLPLLLL